MNTIEIYKDDLINKEKSFIERNLEVELENTKLLQSLSMQLASEDNAQMLYEKIMDAAMQIMRSQYASLQMLRRDTDNKDKLQLLAFRGFNKEAAKFWEWVYADDSGSTCGQALRTGKRYIASNVLKDPTVRGTEHCRVYINTGIYAVQTTPLYSRGGNLVGMISTHWDKQHEPLEYELRLLDLLARQAADLIEQVQYKQKLKESEEKYRSLFEHMNESFFLAEMIYDETGRPLDYIHLVVNPAFEKVVGLKREAIVGKTRRDLSLSASSWLDIFSKVSETGEPTVFEGFSEWLKRHFIIKVFSPCRGQFACVSRDITGRKMAEARINRDKEKAEILYEVTDKLLKSVNPQDIIEELCEKVMKFLKCDVFFNYLVEEQVMKLKLNASGGITQKLHKEMEWLDFGEAICGCAAQEGCTIVVEKIQSTSDIRGNFVRSLGVRAYAVFPLMEHDEVIGTLSFGTKSKDTFNEEELALMKAIANHVSIAMNRMRTEQILLKQQQQIIKSENEKRQTLERALEMKDEFLSLVSHELRTPINVIYAAIQVTISIYSSKLPDKVNGYIRTIKQNTLRQLRLVNNLLDITRVNSGHIKINKRNTDIVFLTKAITESVAQYASQKGVQINFIASLENKIIGIDEEKYERIILNLLSNAIKFTPKGKSITVKLLLRGDSIYVDVIDYGIGIPSDKVDLIFERFGQVDSSLSRQAEGTGIGLSLVKKFVEALGGKISVKSKVGKGSTFTVQLPSEKVLEEQYEIHNTELLDSRLVDITNVEFSDIYL
ncbi:MAG: multi-sensor hybrid histidine kinase [Clostridia bacterium]|nr:multi-sensor hybrid histidine kinase [Clostridia bacterium]